jgi:hypothetical protein
VWSPAAAAVDDREEREYSGGSSFSTMKLPSSILSKSRISLNVEFKSLQKEQSSEAMEIERASRNVGGDLDIPPLEQVEDDYCKDSQRGLQDLDAEI